MRFQADRTHKLRKVFKMGFSKGVSGNPGGKSNSFHEFTQIARRMSRSALYRIQQLAQTHPDANIRLAADKVLLERAWGRPVTPVSVNAESLGRPAFVIRVPTQIASAEDWEKTVELERTAYESQPALPPPAPQPTPEALGATVESPPVEKPTRVSRVLTGLRPLSR
jgi:hypothetical protein